MNTLDANRRGEVAQEGRDGGRGDIVEDEALPVFVQQQRALGFRQ